MHQTFTLQTPYPTEKIFAVVSNIETYPHWLDLVTTVTPATNTNKDKKNGNAWNVTLRARIGPIARSKKLRMVEEKTTHTSNQQNTVTLIRQEITRTSYSPWTMKLTVQPNETTETTSQPHSTLTGDLHYGGKFWNTALESVFQAHIKKTEKKLYAYLEKQEK